MIITNLTMVRDNLNKIFSSKDQLNSHEILFCCFCFVYSSEKHIHNLIRIIISVFLIVNQKYTSTLIKKTTEMWQAMESSIQAFDKTLRTNTSFKNRITSKRIDFLFYRLKQID